MKVVILCGGQGTRIRELTELIPKPMVEVGGHPILWQIMKIYSHYSYKDFILCLGYKGDVIRNYFLQYDLLHSDFTVELGGKRITPHTCSHDEQDWRICLAETGADTMTGGRLKNIEQYVDEDVFMLTYGDGVADIDIDALLSFHKTHGRIATVTAVRPVARFGELELDGDLARSFQEKPQTNEGWINGGFFVFNRRIFDYLDGDDCILEREPLGRLASEGELAVYRHHGYWRCMDTQRDAEFLNAEWANGNPPWAVWQAPLSDGAAA